VNDPKRNQSAVGVEYDDDVISLYPYLQTLLRYRIIIVGAVVAVSVAFLIGLLAMLLLYPSERIASLRFRLMFDGAAQGEYPNKTPFSFTEIVGAPVVAEVFKANDLQQYGKSENFKDALFIQQSNPELDQLTYEYRSKLADPKLTSVDRSRIEAEFAQKRATQTDPSFSLSLRRSENFGALPDALSEKVLKDTLAEWAAQADRMGATKYELPILSSLMVSGERPDSEDYLTAAERLRSTADRMVETLSGLEKVPGAHTVRASKDGLSLVEIWVKLEDALRFDLEPLLGVIRSEGVTKDGRQLKLYVSTQIFKRQLERQAAEERARAVQSALAGYVVQRGASAGSDAQRSGASVGGTRPQGFDTPVLVPQFSEAFLARLAEMATTSQKSEMEYRQKLTDMIIDENIKVSELNKEMAYYQDILKSVQGIGSGPAGSAEALNLVKTKSQAAFSAIENCARQLVDIYNQLSAKNLSPEARLYAITGPFTRQTQQSFSYRSAALSFVLALLLTLFATTVGCFIHAALKQRPQA
jgi:hypothetical protein